jgi:hypothetical protein
LNGAEKGVGMIPNSHVGIETTISKSTRKRQQVGRAQLRLYLCTSFPCGAWHGASSAFDVVGWVLFIAAAAAACVGTCSFFVYTYLHHSLVSCLHVDLLLALVATFNRPSPKLSPFHNSPLNLPLQSIHPNKTSISQPLPIPPQSHIWINNLLDHPRLPFKKLDKFSKPNPSLVVQGEIPSRSRRILIPHSKPDPSLRRLSEEHPSH